MLPVTAVLVALVTGALALLPSVALTRRHRLLKRIAEEAAAVKAIEDPTAKADMEEALAISTWSYLVTVRPDPSPSVERSLVGSVFLKSAVGAGVLLSVAAVLIVLNANLHSQTARNWITVAGAVIGLGVAFVVTFLQMRDFKTYVLARERARVQAANSNSIP